MELRRIYQRQKRYMLFAVFLMFLSFALRKICCSPMVKDFNILQAGLDLAADIFPFCFLTGWCGLIHNRILNRRLKMYLLMTGFLMMLWMLIRIVKWNFLYSDDLERYAWYLYYIPIILIPLLGAKVSLYLGRAENYNPPGALKLLYLPAGALMLAVLSNDIHQMVFRFPKGLDYGETDYQYGPVYWVIATWILCLLVFFLVNMLRKSRISENYMMPWVITGAAIVLCVLYIRRIVKFDMTFMSCLVIILLVECAICGRLIPSNTGYSELFRNCTLGAVIVDTDGKICIRSECAETYSEEIIKAITGKGTVELEGKNLHGVPIRGGYVLWEEDIRQYQKLKEQLKETNAQLAEKNKVLEQELAVKEQKSRVEERNRLYDWIAEGLDSQLTEVEALLKISENHPEQTQNLLTEICVISAYIKRRGNLMLIGEEQKTVSSRELEYCLRESADYIRLMGASVWLSSGNIGDISVTTAVEAYDLFEKLVECVLLQMDALMMDITVGEGYLKLRVQMGYRSGSDVSKLEMLTDTDKRITCTVQDEDIFAVITVPCGEVWDDNVL